MQIDTSIDGVKDHNDFSLLVVIRKRHNLKLFEDTFAAHGLYRGLAVATIALLELAAVQWSGIGSQDDS